ncbi:MAG: hypothetical protein KGR16_06710 [Verrucomicrobia bacterium]|nr:hypothetical protein [Verrucomicrobiota bacterium]
MKRAAALTLPNAKSLGYFDARFVAAIRHTLLLSLLGIISMFYTVHKSHKPMWCLGLSILFVVFSTDLRKKTVSRRSIKKLLFPEVFAIAGMICFLLLAIQKMFGKPAMLKGEFGLFLPILLLGLTYVSNLFLHSAHHTVYLLRKWCIENIYRKNPFLVKTYILTSYMLAVGLIVAYSLFVFKSSLHDLDWYFFGFVNKRCQYAVYLLCVVFFLFFPYICAAFVRPRDPSLYPQRSYSLAKRVACVVVGVLIATYFWGPPWHMDLAVSAPDPHEVVHLGPLLAIKQGKIPYSEAPIQYGPGVQLFQYFYMNHFGFDLYHLREGFFVLHFIFALIVFICIWMYFSAFEAATISLFCLCIDSILHFFSFSDAGGPIGFWGWAVGFRYLAPPLLAMAMAHQFTQSHSQRAHPFLIGCLYGCLLLMAQENFSCGICTLVLGSLLAYSSRSATFQDLKRVGFYFVLGVALSLAPVVLFYASHYQLQAFVGQYFRISSAVASGFSNTPWSSGFNHPAFLPYILTPVILFGIGFYNLYCKRQSDLRVLLLLVSAISLHQVSLFRADSSHFVAPCLALPILFGLIFSNTVQNSGLTWKETLGYASPFLLLISSVYSRQFNLKSFVSTIIRPSSRYFASVSPRPEGALFFAPFGFYRDPMSRGSTDTDACTCEYIAEMKAIQHIVGNRATIVDFNFPCTSSLYFFANLKIGTKMIESYHSVLNRLDREEFLREIRLNPIQAFITNDLQSRETLVFLERFPQAKIHHRVLGKVPYFICVD